MAKTEENFRVIVYPQPNWLRSMDTKSICKGLVEDIEAKIEDVKRAEMVWDEECSFCGGRSEMGSSTPTRPICCVAAMKEWDKGRERKEKRDD